MKRHILLALLRMLLAVGVVYALPLSHSEWGVSYPGDGQQGFGFIIIFFNIGIVAGLVFVGLGSLAQILLRRRPARLTVLADLGLFLVFAGTLVYGGVTAKYHVTPPGPRTPVAIHASCGPARCSSGSLGQYGMVRGMVRQ